MEKIQLSGKTVVITGVAGFIGAALAQKLLHEIECIKIIGIDNINSYYDIKLKQHRLAENQVALSKNITSEYIFFEGDISDKGFINRIFNEFQPEVVVNLAAQAGVRYSIDNPDVYIQSNIVGFYNILEACRHSYDNGRLGVEHLVYASSSSVYGLNDKVPYSTEDKVDSPVSLYAATKKANELLAHSYSNLYQIPSTGLRFFTVYGPYGRPDMAYFSFAEKLRRGEKISLYNYGNCERDFTYIDDITEGIKRVMMSAPSRNEKKDGRLITPYAIYNIGNHCPINLHDFVKILSDSLIDVGILPNDFCIEDHIDLVPMQSGDVNVTFADISQLENDYGYRPRTSIIDGIERFAKWYKAYAEKQ